MLDDVSVSVLQQVYHVMQRVVNVQIAFNIGFVLRNVQFVVWYAMLVQPRGRVSRSPTWLGGDNTDIVTKVVKGLHTFDSTWQWCKF